MTPRFRESRPSLVAANKRIEQAVKMLSASSFVTMVPGSADRPTLEQTDSVSACRSVARPVGV
jgi:hypothetical protein